VSDHFSGPRAIAGPAGDICDLYAFPSPDHAGRLVLVMNVLPRAGPSACFSDAIICRFRLRPVTAAADGPPAAFAVGADEVVFDCAFDAPYSRDGAGPLQRGCCTPAAGERIAFEFNDERGAGRDGLRVYAGLRSDPFFIDLPAYQETVKRGRLAFKATGTNSLAGFNVLSLVIEADCAPLLDAGGPLFAVVGETISAGKLPIRLERVGRPEIKNVVLSWKQFDPVNRDLDVRDLYNLEDAFHLGQDYRGVYRARLDANLAALDRLDGKTAWPLGAGGAHPLTELLLADYLVVDASKPYAEDSFFEIERALLQGRAHATCGGRSLNDDVMDTLYTLLINGDGAPRIGDGVDRATAPAGRVFPYLAPPNPPPLATQKGRQP
jgi:Domain of unknown function (DUF4331)